MIQSFDTSLRAWMTAAALLAFSLPAEALQILEPLNESPVAFIDSIKVILDAPLKGKSKVVITLDGRNLKVIAQGADFQAPITGKLKPGVHVVRASAQTIAGTEKAQVRFYVPGPTPEGGECRSDVSCQSLYCETWIEKPSGARHDLNGDRYTAHCAVRRSIGDPCRRGEACLSGKCKANRFGDGVCAGDSALSAYCDDDHGCTGSERCIANRCQHEKPNPPNRQRDNSPSKGPADVRRGMLDGTMLAR